MSDFHQIMNAVKEFHTSFGIDHKSEPTAALDEKTIQLRHRLMAEENDEYLEAATNNDLVQVADALGDKLYILCGTIISHGLQHKIVEVFEEIHRSNMSKLDADGKPIYREDGKVMKSELYFLPNIESVLLK
jgi:predicted HAD superfamily Cof-like phosphohydrolase